MVLTIQMIEERSYAPLETLIDVALSGIFLRSFQTQHVDGPVCDTQEEYDTYI